MAQRGRRGPLTSATIVPFSPLDRPPAPKEFSAAERKIWDDTVSGMKASWFNPACAAILRGYCLQCVVADNLSAEMRELTSDSLRYEHLAKLHRNAMKTVLLCARALRLTPHANKPPREGHDPSARLAKPWELDDKPA
jgi:hypothetical protein